MERWDRLFAACYDPAMARAERGALGRRRRELLADLAGHVVDVGAGTGANLPHLGPAVTRLTLVEPSPAMLERLERRLPDAARDIDEVRARRAPAEALPLPDASADVVVCVLVLCSAHDPRLALSEIRRVLRPGGRLVLLEHVRGHGATLVVQRLLSRPWRAAARGCHLDRDTRSLVAGAGFDVTAVRPWRLPGGGPAAPAISGVAIRR